MIIHPIKFGNSNCSQSTTKDEPIPNKLQWTEEDYKALREHNMRVAEEAQAILIAIEREEKLKEKIKHKFDVTV